LKLGLLEESGTKQTVCAVGDVLCWVLGHDDDFENMLNKLETALAAAGVLLLTREEAQALNGRKPV
jgi:hypothetical protein